MKAVRCRVQQIPFLRESRTLGETFRTRFWFVWGVWSLMLTAAFGFVVRFGSNVPYWDDWGMAPALAGEEHIDAHWFWQERNGHRVPFPRLFLLALYKLTGCDFRSGMYFNAAILGMVAFAMIIVARKQRG